MPAIQPITMPATSPPLKFTPPLAAADVLGAAEFWEPDDEVAVPDVAVLVEVELAVKAIESSAGMSQLSTL